MSETLWQPGAAKIWILMLAGVVFDKGLLWADVWVINAVRRVRVRVRVCMVEWRSLGWRLV